MVILLMLMQLILPLIHLKLKKIKGETGNDGRENVEIMVPLKYLRKL